MVSASYLELLARNPRFRRLWLGEVVSFLGDWFSMVALYAMVQELTGSAQAVAAVLIGKTLPIFLVMPIAGPLVDRFDRRRLLIATDLARALCVLGLIAAWRLESLPLLFTVLFVKVGFSGIFIPARTAVIPQVTSPRELPAAMALSGGTWSVMLAVGAALGGLATEGLGIEGALLIDAATFLVSAAFLWGLPPLPPREEGEEAGEAGFLAGLRYLRTRPYLAGLLSLKGAMALASGALVMLPIYGNGLFVGAAGPLWIGLLYSARGLGALVGSMGVRRVVGDAPRTMRALLAPGFVLSALALLALAAAPNIGAAALAFLVAAVGNGIVWVFSGTLAQQSSDREVRGRLFSLEFGVMTLIVSITSWVCGALVDHAGWTPREVVAASGLLMLVPAVAWTLLLARLGIDRDAARA